MRSLALTHYTLQVKCKAELRPVIAISAWLNPRFLHAQQPALLRSRFVTGQPQDQQYSSFSLSGFTSASCSIASCLQLLSDLPALLASETVRLPQQ